MKFPKTHHERILEILKFKGFQKEDYYLVKRKGWIRIEHLGTGKFFSYFKKKETRINKDTKEWEHNVYFKVKVSDGPENMAQDFDRMMVLFEKWVDGIPI